MKRKGFDPNEAEDRARLMVALVLSLIILFGFNFFMPQDETPAKKEDVISAATPAVAAPAALLPRAEILQSGGRINITGDNISGSLSLKGARLDDLELNGHFKTVEKKEKVSLLSPKGAVDAFYVDNGWVAPGGAAVPDENSVWQVKAGSPSEIRAGGDPVTLVWDNGAGLLFETSISLDEGYLFTVTQKVTNRSAGDVVLNPYHLAARNNIPHDFSGFFVHHEGPISFLNGDGQETDYSDLVKEAKKGRAADIPGAKGWLGITDKYWMVTLLPAKDTSFNARMVATPRGNEQHTYQIDAVLPSVTVPAGGVAEEKSHVYAGVKSLKLIQSYQKDHGFTNLEYSIDFGMWWFITKPFYYLLHLLMHSIGNVGAAILVMTVIVRGAVFPLANKSFRSMAKMKLVAPKLKELQEKHGHDKAKLQMEIFELYKKEDVNPFSGCWPILIQIPIFFALYKVILISVELRHAPFWGWVDDLSAPDPTTIFNLFGLINWQPPQALMLGAWPIIFGLTMILQKRISPPMPDPMQEKIQTWFPYIVTIMMAHFAVGLVIYWAWSNILGTLQQFYILKKVGGEETSLIRGHAARRKKKTK